MDDLKLLGATANQLQQMLRIVEEFSNDIKMKFGLNKCRTINIVRGKLQEGGFEMQNGQNIAAMEAQETYKYLGMKQAQRIEQQTMKQEFTKEFLSRIRRVLKSNLNSKNTFKALNTYAFTALNYSFGIIKWSRTDIQNMQRKTRTLLMKAKKHHPRSALERTTLPRNQGGRGLADLERQLEGQITNLRAYFFRKVETSILHRAVCDADDSTPLRLKEREMPTHNRTDGEKMQAWMEKPLHGRYSNEINQDYVDREASNYWLTSGQLFPETEGFMLAIQDQVIATRNYLKYFVKDPTVQNDKCRYGCQTVETIQHVTGGCQAFAPTEYKERHDSVAKIIHQELALKFKLGPVDRVQDKPEVILENNEYRLYWDRTILTDQRVTNNRPDLIFTDKRSKKTMLIDVAIPNINLREKHNEKILKYRDLQEQVRRQWQM